MQVVKQWRRRWFTLKGDTLWWAHSPTEAPHGRTFRGPLLPLLPWLASTRAAAYRSRGPPAFARGRPPCSRGARPRRVDAEEGPLCGVRCWCPAPSLAARSISDRAGMARCRCAARPSPPMTSRRGRRSAIIDESHVLHVLHVLHALHVLLCVLHLPHCLLHYDLLRSPGVLHHRREPHARQRRAAVSFGAQLARPGRVDHRVHARGPMRPPCRGGGGDHGH